MFCPRCGRAVSETSNFCGGCGLSRAEIEKYIVKTEVPKPEAVQPQPEAKTEPRTVSWESQPAQEMPKAEPASTVQESTQPSFAEQEIIAEEAKKTEEAKAEQPEAEPEVQPYNEYTTVNHAAGENEHSAQQSKTADSTQYSYKTAESTQPNYTQPDYSYTEPVKEVKNENLSTVDFIWMMVISGIPVVGLIYLIVLAFSNDNMNKRSYARASLIISIFASVISIVFVIGFILSGAW